VAGERCADRRVVQRLARDGELRLGLRDRRGRDRQRRRQLLVRALREDAALEQLVVARHLGLRARFLRLRLLERGVGLLHFQRRVAIVEPDEHLAVGDRVADIDGRVEHLAGHLRRDVGRFIGDERARRPHDRRYGPCNRLRRRNRHRRRVAGRRRRRRRRLDGLVRFAAACEQQCAEQADARARCSPLSRDLHGVFVRPCRT
jgi:hypothetical protein